MTGKGRLSLEGKKIRGQITFQKGKEFVGASISLRQTQGVPTYVQIYLLLQGIEIICKAILLLENYDMYSKLLKKKFGHDLQKLVEEVKNMHRISNLNADFDTSLNELVKGNGWIALRYGELIDIFHDPETFETAILYKKSTQAIKCYEKRMKNGS